MTEKFTLDFDNTFEGFEEIKDGNYEVIIDHVTEGATQTGSEYANVQMTIRNDLDQPFTNNKVWHRIWKTKATGQYNMIMFNTIGNAIGLDSKKEYSGMDELLDDYERQPLLIFVKNEKSDYDGNVYLEVKSWKKSKFPDVQHSFKGGGNKPKKDNEGPFKDNDINIDDSDLPF